MATRQETKIDNEIPETRLLVQSVSSGPAISQNITFRRSSNSDYTILPRVLLQQGAFPRERPRWKYYVSGDLRGNILGLSDEAYLTLLPPKGSQRPRMSMGKYPVLVADTEEPLLGKQIIKALEWDIPNGRRIDLIEKQFTVGLTEPEKEELVELETYVDSYLDRVAPLPFDTLDIMQNKLQEISSRKK